MDLTKINNLPELFFCQYKEQKDRNKILLSSLREFGKNYSWQQTFDTINIISSELKKYFLDLDSSLDKKIIQLNC